MEKEGGGVEGGECESRLSELWARYPA